MWRLTQAGFMDKSRMALTCIEQNLSDIWSSHCHLCQHQKLTRYECEHSPRGSCVWPGLFLALHFSFCAKLRSDQPWLLYAVTSPIISLVYIADGFWLKLNQSNIDKCILHFSQWFSRTWKTVLPSLIWKPRFWWMPLHPLRSHLFQHLWEKTKDFQGNVMWWCDSQSFTSLFWGLLFWPEVCNRPFSDWEPWTLTLLYSTSAQSEGHWENQYTTSLEKEQNPLKKWRFSMQ